MPDKKRSLLALDALNFFNAGIQTGLGPFIAIYYAADRHLNPGQIGLLWGVQNIAGVISQTAIGHAVDETKHKRLATAIAAVVVVLGCLGIYFAKAVPLQAAAQAGIGVAVTVFPASTSAFASGLVDPKENSKNIARNERFTHGGNVIFAAVAAVLALGDIFTLPLLPPEWASPGLRCRQQRRCQSISQSLAFCLIEGSVAKLKRIHRHPVVMSHYGVARRPKTPLMNAT